MQVVAPEPPRAPARRRSFAQRAQSVPRKTRYAVALFFSAAFYLSVIGAATAVYACLVQPGRPAGLLLCVLGVASVLLWLVSFLLRRRCHCPLCHGTPLADMAARPHDKAVRFAPLNYGTSNVVRAMVRQHFRCQYCGTPFDLLKPAGSPRLEPLAHPPVALTAMDFPPARPAQPHCPPSRLVPPAA